MIKAIRLDEGIAYCTRALGAATDGVEYGFDGGRQILNQGGRIEYDLIICDHASTRGNRSMREESFRR